MSEGVLNGIDYIKNRIVFQFYPEVVLGKNGSKADDGQGFVGQVKEETGYSRKQNEGEDPDGPCRGLGIFFNGHFIQHFKPQ